MRWQDGSMMSITKECGHMLTGQCGSCWFCQVKLLLYSFILTKVAHNL